MNSSTAPSIRTAGSLKRRTPKLDLKTRLRASWVGFAWPVVLAAFGGLTCALAFAPYQWWMLAPLGLAALIGATERLRVLPAAAVGMVWGWSFFLPLLHWSGVYVGWLPWVLLATSQATFVMFFTVLLAWFSHRRPILFSSALRLTVRKHINWHVHAAQVALVVSSWVLLEVLRANFPWGGFAWGRLAFASTQVPWLPLARWGSPAALSAWVALLAALMAISVQQGAARIRTLGHTPAVKGHRRAVGSHALMAALVILMVALGPQLLAQPHWAPEDQQITLAVVQGNVPRMGLDFNAQRQAVLNNHIKATHQLAQDIQTGEIPQPDVVIWPENSSDIDPFANPQAYQAISQAAQAVQAPLIVGAVLSDTHARYNTALLWWPDGPDPHLRYTKRHPVPFAEYIPLRSLARWVSDKVDLVPVDFVAGHQVGFFDVPLPHTPTGNVPLGVLICFEISNDGLVRDVLAAGAGPIAVLTNNATFGFTPQSEQQLIITQIQAASMQRPVFVAATSGISAIIDAQGSVEKRSRLFTSEVLVATVRWSDDHPPSQWGQPLLLAILGLMCVALVVAAIFGDTNVQPEKGDVMGKQPFSSRKEVSPSTSSELNKVLVIIPTYNESRNLEMIVSRTRRAAPQASILIADDNSPDGTGDKADALAEADPMVSVLHRHDKQGLGAAYLAGFAWGIERGFEVLVEMDADGSHQPEQLPRLLQRLTDADLVIGSRWVPGGSVRNWPAHRQLLSRGANVYVRLALGMKVRDATAGFRAYRASALQQLDLEDVSSQGYCFQVDLTWRTVRHGLRVAEVPIEFVEREQGTSKMSRGIIAEALLKVTRWGLSSRLGALRSGLLTRPQPKTQPSNDSEGTPTVGPPAAPTSG